MQVVGIQAGEGHGAVARDGPAAQGDVLHRVGVSAHAQCAARHGKRATVGQHIAGTQSQHARAHGGAAAVAVGGVVECERAAAHFGQCASARYHTGKSRRGVVATAAQGTVTVDHDAASTVDRAHRVGGRHLVCRARGHRHCRGIAQGAGDDQSSRADGGETGIGVGTRQRQGTGGRVFDEVARARYGARKGLRSAGRVLQCGGTGHADAALVHTAAQKRARAHGQNTSENFCSTRIAVDAIEGDGIRP